MKKPNAYRLAEFSLVAMIVLAVATVGMPVAPVPLDAVSRAETSTRGDSQSDRTGLSATKAAVPEHSGSEVPVDGSSKPIAARWVDGKAVPLTSAQLAELEEKIYRCGTQAEVDALMGTLAYYNKGIDASRFPWYWDDLAGIYSDEQLAMLKSGKVEKKRVPDLTGMTAEDAYRLMTDLGFLLRLSYYYTPDATQPIGRIYEQDADPGTLWNTDACIMAIMQGPKEIHHTSVGWDADDPDSDILAYAKALRESGKDVIDVPDVVGLQADEAKNALVEAGFQNVVVTFVLTEDGIAPGECISQNFAPGLSIYSGVRIEIRARKIPPVDYVVPDVVGLSEVGVIAALGEIGLTAHCVYVDEPESGIAPGYCVRQGIAAGTVTKETSMDFFVQVAHPTTEP